MIVHKLISIQTPVLYLEYPTNHFGKNLLEELCSKRISPLSKPLFFYSKDQIEFELIGTGYAQVFLSKDKSKVVKVFSEHFSKDKNAIFKELTIQNFTSERVEGIPRIHCLYYYNKRYYMVMDKVEGKTLRNLQSDSLDINTQKNIVKIIQKKLQQLHSIGVAHMDPHDSNVMVSSDYQKVFLIDFGLSKFKPETADINKELKTLIGGLKYIGFPLPSTIS